MYQRFAQIYDSLMAEVDYQKWADYLEKLFILYEARPRKIIDLACGTGNITIPLSKKGYQMTGIDISQDMLTIADQKANEQSLDIQWICQDMKELDGFQGMDAVICACDGLNYILNKNDLKEILNRAQQALKGGGILAFDLNSKYKIEHILADSTFAFAGEEISYIWENFLDHENNIIDFELSFFVRDGDCYQRFNETHQQRSYTTKEIVELLQEENFKNINYFEAYTFSKPDNECERIQFIAQK